MCANVLSLERQLEWHACCDLVVGPVNVADDFTNQVECAGQSKQGFLLQLSRNSYLGIVTP